MIDDFRFYDLSAKQARYNIGKRRLDKLPERVYDRDVNLRKEQETLPIEEKYENQFLLEEIFGEKKEAKA